MGYALGRFLPLRVIHHPGGVVFALLVVLAVVLVRYWPAITAWLEGRWRRR